MKRAMFAKRAVSLLGCAVLTACSPPAAPRTVEQREENAAAWTRPPAIATVLPTQTGLVIAGEAEPGARVVLRSPSGAAYGTVADAAGRFEIRISAPAGDLLLRPEIQIGQDTAPSPDQLLILAGGRGPIVVLRAGGPTRRLDPAPALAAVDSDGRMRLASGQSPAGGASVRLEAGGESAEVIPDSQGRWRLVLTRSAGPDEIRLGEQIFLWPGEKAEADDMRVERAGLGWRIVWSGPGGTRQTTWLPDGV